MNHRVWLPQIRAAIRLMRVPGIGAAAFRRMMRVFGSPIKAWAALQNGHLPDHGFDFSRPTAKRNRPELTEHACRSLTTFSSTEGGTWFGARDYPWRLRRIPEPPPVLFYRGLHTLLLPRHDDWAVAVVGARQASAAGRTAARLIAAGIVREGGGVVSGLATGIDTEAHDAALEAAGVSIAVVATGIDVPYPPSSGDLWQRLGRHGLIVTEFFPGTPPVRSHFPTRNRIIAGMADAVVFIEGTAHSGGLITLAKARAMRRPILALGGRDLVQGGAEELIRRKWVETLESDPEEVLEKLRALRETTWPRRASRYSQALSVA